MSLSRYYQKICEEPMLTKEEEVELVTIFKDPASTDKARQAAKDRILKANLRFVFKQAKYFSRNDPSMFEVLIAAGNEGLVVGLNKYDLSRNTKFLSYAGWWVNQKILKEMSLMRIVSLPIWKQQLANRIAKVKTSNSIRTFEELQTYFPDVAEKDLRELSDTRYLTYYMDDLPEGEFESDVFMYDMDKEIDNNKLFDMVMTLESPYKEILALSYGLIDGKELKNSQIARRLMLTKDQLKELKKEALEMMKGKLSTGT